MLQTVDSRFHNLLLIQTKMIHSFQTNKTEVNKNLSNYIFIVPKILIRTSSWDVHLRNWMGGWVDPRAGLDVEARENILCPCRGSNPDRPARSHSH